MLRAVAVVVLAVGAAVVAGSTWGGVSREVGPVDAELRVVPSVRGGLDVAVPPLGRLRLDTHAGPLQLRATVTDLRPVEARRLLRARDPAAGLVDQVAADGRNGLRDVVLRSAGVALLAAAGVNGLVFRRRRDVLVGTASAALVLTAATGIAALTLRTEALTEPTFTGPLAQAPAVVSSVRDFGAYGRRLAELATSVARVYGAVSVLPAAEDDEDDVAVLWVSDIHNNPTTYSVMAQLVQQFRVQAVVDTGDLTDLGSAAETRLFPRIGALGVPYLYVRGNHDSALTQAAVARQPNVRVLDDGAVVEVAGLRWAGTGDPLFTPTKQVQTDEEAGQAVLRRAGEELARAVEASPEPVDVALVHEPGMAGPLFGSVPLVLDGHVHRRRATAADGTLELTQGSSGGAGLRTLEGDRPLPLELSVLHFDRRDGSLRAVDEISVGGVGERSVTLTRRTPQAYLDDADEPREALPGEGARGAPGAAPAAPPPLSAARARPRER